LKDLGVHGKTYFKETGWEGVDWMHPAQDRDQWRALEDTIMNVRGSIKGREFLD